MGKAMTGLMVLAGGAIAYTLWNREDAERDEPSGPEGELAGAETADVSEVLQRIDDEARFGGRSQRAHTGIRDKAR